MEQGLLLFLFSASVISLTGVMSPGPMTAVTISHGGRSASAGLYISLGHGVVEFPLIFLIFLGAGSVLQSVGFRIAIGVLGGLFLLHMGKGLIRPKADSPPLSGTPPAVKGSAFSSGIALSIGNPYFLLWWATVGVGLVIGAVRFGLLGLVLFAVIHWLLDLVWFSFLSVASNRGMRTFGAGFMTKINFACGLVMLFFGGLFILSSIKLLIGPQA